MNWRSFPIHNFKMHISTALEVINFHGTIHTVIIRIGYFSIFM